MNYLLEASNGGTTRPNSSNKKVQDIYINVLAFYYCGFDNNLF